MEKILVVEIGSCFVESGCAGQTIFEQAMARRSSSRYPICYYDLTPDGIRRIPGTKANKRIEQMVNSSLAPGIRKGDRVALN